MSAPSISKKRAAFPAGVVNPTQCGSRINVLMACMHHQHYMPYQRGDELLRTIFGGRICAATLVNITAEVSAAVVPEQAEREAQLKAVAVSHADETGLRVAGKGYWGHVHCSDRAVQLYLRPHRGR